MTVFKRLALHLLILLTAALAALVLFSADKRPAETTDEVIAASDELARFANEHPEIDYYDARRDPPKEDAPWTVELYMDIGPKVVLTWSEVGYSHLSDAVTEIEKDFSAYPHGHEGHSSE